MVKILRFSANSALWIAKQFGCLLILLVFLNALPIVYVAFAFYSWWIGILTLLALGGMAYAVLK